MQSYSTFIILVAAGISWVIQNLVMKKYQYNYHTAAEPYQRPINNARHSMHKNVISSLCLSTINRTVKSTSLLNRTNLTKYQEK